MFHPCVSVLTRYPPFHGLAGDVHVSSADEVDQDRRRRSAGDRALSDAVEVIRQPGHAWARICAPVLRRVRLDARKLHR